MLQHILETVCSNQQNENGTKRIPGRNSSRRNFGEKGGQGFKKYNNDGRQKASTKKTLAEFTFNVGMAK